MPAVGTLDGTLTGSGTATGEVILAVDGFPFKTVPFLVDAGPFSKNLFSAEVPTIFGDSLILSGSLDLSLPAGDTFFLPNSLGLPSGKLLSLLACHSLAPGWLVWLR